MANNYEQIMALVNAGNKMGLSNTITRDNGIPLDLSSVQPSFNDAVIYAATKAIAYQNQILAAEGVVYIIVSDSQGQVEINGETYENYLKPVGTIPTGDDASISVTSEGLVSIFGFGDAQNGTLPVREGGKLIWKTLEDIGAGDGNDDTTYEFALNTTKTGIIVTPKFNGQPVEKDGEQVTYELALDVYTKGEVNELVAGALSDAKTYTDDELAGISVEIAKKTVGEGDSAIEVEHIILKNKDGLEIASASASKFVQDSFLDDVEYKDGKINFTWTMGDGSTKTDSVDVADFVQTYQAGNGLTLTSNEFSVDTSVIATVEELAKKANSDIVYTKSEIDLKIGTPGVPEVKDGEGNTTQEKVIGTGIFASTYSKDEINALLDEVEGGSTESAASVARDLETYISTNNNRVSLIETKDSNQDEAIAAAKTQADKGVTDAATAQAAADEAKLAITNLTTGQVKTNTDDIAALVTRVENNEKTLTTYTTETKPQVASNTADIKTLKETTIPNINLSLNSKADASSVYTKTEVDGLVGAKANAADVYTKKETDDAIAAAVAGKDLSAYATKTYVDEAIAPVTTDLAKKANAADVYTKTDADAAFMTQDKVDARINALIAASDPDGDGNVITNIQNLVEYVENNADSLAELVTTVGNHTTAINKNTEDIADLTTAVEEIVQPKASDEVTVATDGTLGLGKVSTDKLVQGTESLVLNGGSATA